MSNHHHESSEGAKLAGQTPPMSLQAQASMILDTVNALLKELEFINFKSEVCIELYRARNLLFGVRDSLPNDMPFRQPPHHPDPASLQHQAVENLRNAFNGGFTEWQSQKVQIDMVTTAVQQIVEAAVARAKMAEGAH